MVEFVVSVVGEVATKVAAYLLHPLARPFTYLFNYRHNVSNLNQQIDGLPRVRQRLQITVDDANRQGLEIFPDVQEWMTYAEGVVGNRDGFHEDEKIASKSCFNFKSRYRLSKRAKREAEEIAAKTGEAREFIGGPGENRVSYRPPPPTSVVPFISSSSFKEYEAFESRETTFNQIMEALTKEDIRTIGLWGMGGVGKTTLVKQVAKRAEEDKLFNKVVMALNISQTPNISEIQGKIARMLGLTFGVNEDRAIGLRQSLKKQGKILVILDDLWDKVELGEIGIPHGDDDDHKGCKLLFTSRERRVLDTDMQTQKVFHVRHLNDEEAWSLFKRTTGDSVDYSPDLQRIALDIVKKCEGLPVAIVTIANALKRETAPVWENALEELRRSAPTNIRGVSKNVYSCLELSYNHLEGDEVKSLFLLCGLLEVGDISMDRLVQYAMGLNLFKGFYSWEKAANKLITLVERLKVSSLLLDTDDEEGDNHRDGSLFFDEAFVRMHDVVRDVARSIASKDPHRFAVKEGVELQEWQREDESRNCRRMSLMCRNIDELAQGPLVCPQLDFFSLNSSHDNPNKRLKILDDFFQDTTQLRVLHLHKVWLAPCPSSLGFLSNLQTLCIRSCEIKDIAAIGKLKRLQILSLAWSSSIYRLPKEMMELRDLRVLDLRHCGWLVVIPRNVISSLSQLEYLSMKGSDSIEWNLDGSNMGERNDGICVSELKNLPGLRSLEVVVRSDLSSAAEDDVAVFRNLNLTRYSIGIGIHGGLVHELKGSRRLVLYDVQSVKMVKCFSNLLKRSESVRLIRLYDYELDEDFKDGFTDLKYLNIEYCRGIHSIPGHAFAKLEVLELCMLEKLETVCEVRSIPKEYWLINLRILRLSACMRLKYVFSLLENERELHFPRLQSLSLAGLYELISFYSTGSSSSSSSQEESMTIFSDKVAFPALESLNVHFLPDVRTLWCNHFAADLSFSKLKTLSIDKCNKLLSIFPLSVAKALVQLEVLKITSCEVLEAIVANEDEDEDLICSNLLLFLKLTSLQLSQLPQLKRFCSRRLIVRWPLLKTVSIQNCDKVEILFQAQLDYQIHDQQPFLYLHEGAFSSLEKLTLKGAMVEIWRGQFSSMSFSKLRVLEISECHGISVVISSSAVPQILHNLDQLEVEECNSASEIIPFDQQRLPSDEEIFGTAETAVVVPRLTQICLKSLPKLIHLHGLHPYFQNLQTLEVVGCESLRNLLTSSTAKRLVKQLKVINVRQCQTMKEIVEAGNDDDDDDDHLQGNEEIEFDRLEELVLLDLPDLKSFCSGTYTLRFPYLKRISVEKCPKMECFCKGVLDAPRLEGTTTSPFYSYWTGDLNTAIREKRIRRWENPRRWNNIRTGCSRHYLY